MNGLLAAGFEICGGYDVRKVDLNEYEVQDLKGPSFIISLAERSCSCFEFQKLRIPCSHAVAVALKAYVRVEDLVDEVYTIRYLKAAYDDHILPPLDLDNTCQLTAEVAALSLNPPATRRPSARPMKKSFFLRGKIRVSIVNITYSDEHVLTW